MDEPGTWPRGGGETGALVRALDGSRTPLGPIAEWSPELRTVVQTVLDLPFPAVVLWGPELVQVYNDGYRGLMGNKHPAGLGQPTRACWPEAWHINEPIYRRVWAGESVAREDALYPVTRSGALEDAWFTLSYSPLRDGAGAVAGVLVTVAETTMRVREARQREHAEAGLRESEARASALVSVLPGSAVFIVDAAMRYRLAQGEALREAGFTSEQLVGRTVEEAVGPALAAEYVPHYRRVLAGEPFEAEHTAHGRTFLTRGTPLRDRAGQVKEALVISVDVTAQHAARAALRDSEARQAFLLELSDALRVEPDADAVASRALRMLSDRLSLDRCYIGIYRLADDRGDFTHQVGNDRVPPVPASVRLSDFPEVLRVAFGQTLVIGDTVTAEGLSEADRQNLGALGLRALVAATLRAGEGHPLWAIVAVSAAPRRWTRGEIDLIENVTERTWAAVERARGEAAAARAERRAERILERMGDAHCVLDRELTIVAVNAATERLLGVPRESVVRRSHGDVFPAWADAPVGHAVRRVVAEGVEQHLTHHHADGGYDLHLELDAYPTDEGGVALFWRDVSERVRAQAALKASEEQYRALFSSMDEGFCVVEVLFDGAGRPHDYRFVETNPAFIQQTGLTGAAGRTMRELRPAHEAHWFSIYGRIALTGEPARFKAPAAALGRWYDVYAFRVDAPAARRVAILFTDITERERAEAALRASEARQTFLLRLSDALRPLTDPVAIQDAAARVLGEHLGAFRVMYAEVAGEPGVEVGTISGRYLAAEATLGSFPDRYDYATFGEHVMALRRRGETMVVADVATDPAFDDSERAAWAAGGVRAAVTVALVKGGRFVADFGVQSAAPRAWTAGEVALVEETAERTWAAVERARAEAALRASEEQFRRAIEEAPIPVIMHGEDGTVLQVSRTWTELTGYTLDEVPTFDAWLTRAYGHGADAVREHVHALFSGEQRTMSIDFPVRTRDGEVRHWSFSASAPGILHDGRRFVVGMALDVTDRLRAEAALREREDQLRLVTDAMPALISYMDAGLYYRFANKQYEPWFGRSPGEIVGLHLREFLGDEAFERLRPHAEIALAGRRHSFEAEIPFRDGGTRRVRSEFVPDFAPDGSVAGYYALATDITAHARAEAALRESEERFRLFAEASSDVLWMRDAERMQWEYLSPAFESVYGYPRPDVAEPDDLRHWAERIEPEDRERALAALQRVRGGERVTFEYRVRRADGEVRWLRDTDFPIRDESGRVRRIGGIGQDVTEQRRREENQALLVDISADLSRLSTEAEIVRTVGARLAARLRLACYHYVDVDEARGEVTVRHFWHALDVPSTLGTYPIGGFVTPEGLAAHRAGATSVVHDVQRELRGGTAVVAALRAGADLQKIGAYVAVPYSQDGRWKAYFAAADSVPRRWTQAEVELIQDVASRVFPRIERVRADAALRNLNEALEQRVETRTAELARTDRARRQVLRQLVTAEEDERRRISRELHDSLGQLVTGLLLGLKALPRGGEGQRARIEDLERLADRIAREMQHMAVQLRPPALDNLGLRLALQAHLEEWSQRFGVEADFHSGGLDGERFPAEVETTLYRVVQEGLNNVVKHAGATRVSLVLERRTGTVGSILEDDGRGFEVEATLASPEKARRLGLRGMRERVALLGGELEIESAEGAGTTLYVRIPLPEDAEAQEAAEA